MIQDRKTGRALLILILLSLAIRAFLAAFLEFGNDEVYYWTYALFPDISHFDHPPMVGYIIQLTTLNLLFDGEFFIRLGSVLLGALNTWLIFMLGKSLKDELAGLYAALLYTGSVYAFIIAGTFILPDTPQLTFWLASLWFLLRAINSDKPEFSTSGLLLAGLSIGLAMLSKYTSAFLLSGAFLYALFIDRRWFSHWQVYVAASLAVLLFLPVLLWNYGNDFISFTYQGERVGFFDAGFRPDRFLTELLGQLFYNNPVNAIIVIVAVVYFFRGRRFMERKPALLLLLVALPPIALFLFFSLFRQTLPHWTGPAWTTLILLGAAYLSDIQSRAGRKKLLPGPLRYSLLILILVSILGVAQIKGGLLFFDRGSSERDLGSKDVSLDMYGWRQLSDEFNLILMEEENDRNIDPGSPFISSRWFPAANIDYYLARPHGLQVLGIGSLDALHKYAWMNEQRGGFRLGMDAWFLTLSRDFRDPGKIYAGYFDKIEVAHVIPVHRNGKHVMNAYFYYLKGLKVIPEDMLVKGK